ncbi:MAG: hypothetical protein PUP92_36935 [Rhizonema sp. PD38]|nr:hypothetical protein [Rhizonema sp. PD38]
MLIADYGKLSKELAVKNHQIESRDLMKQTRWSIQQGGYLRFKNLMY